MKNLRMTFINSEKAYSWSREVLWKNLEKEDVCMTYIRTIYKTSIMWLLEYNEVTIRISRGDTKDFRRGQDYIKVEP